VIIRQAGNPKLPPRFNCLGGSRAHDRLEARMERTARAGGPWQQAERPSTYIGIRFVRDDGSKNSKNSNGV
jgi:hypothetical protein